MSQKPKQLKKNDFLNAIPETPITREQLVESLDEYDFIASWLDYLIDHFTAANKIVVDPETGTICRKMKKSSAPKDIFRVVAGEDGYTLEQKENSGNISDEDKAEGWSVTANAAIKKACSAVFQNYKDQTEAIKALNVASEEVAEEEPTKRGRGRKKAA